MVLGTKYRVLCVCKTAMHIKEPTNKGYAVINDCMYPNGLYCTLVIRFAEEKDVETMDMPPSKEALEPGSIKLYGNEDVCVDLVYKCIRDVEICDLLYIGQFGIEEKKLRRPLSFASLFTYFKSRTLFNNCIHSIIGYMYVFFSTRD